MLEPGPNLALEEAEEVWTRPEGTSRQWEYVTSMVKCELFVRCTLASPKTRGVHWRIPKYLRYAKAMSMVPPPLWSGCIPDFKGSVKGPL